MSFRRYMSKALVATTLVTGVLLGGQVAFANGNTANTLNALNNVSPSDEFASGKIIVAFIDGYNISADDNKGLNSLGLGSLEVESARELGKAKKPGKVNSASEEIKMKKTLVVTLKDKSKGAVLKAIEELKKQSCVAYAEPDYLIQATDVIPNDTYYGNLYGMTKIGAPLAWNKCTGNDEIVVGVIDTGINYTHPDLADNIWTNPGEIAGDGIDNDNNGYVDDIHGWDFYDNDSDPMDDNSHGTHCAGTIAGVGNNGTGVVGVSWNSKVAALKFIGALGGATSDAIEAINYATAMGFDLTNNSWGNTSYSQALSDAISAGGLFVAAAGNYASDSDSTPFYPACYELDNIISVAATDSNDELASFSNYGATSVDLSAPGVSIYSTILGEQYGYKNGTSMAAPHVSGTAALLLSANSSLSSAQIKELILSNVDSVSGLQGMAVTGGRLNIANTMDKLKGYINIGDVTLDGDVNSGDYTILKRYLLEIITLTPEQLVAGDVSGDGKVNSGDYTLLNKYLLDLSDTFPAGDTFTYTFGDVNNDSKVSDLDANLVESYLSGNTVLSNKQILSADVDGSGIVDTNDLSILNDYISGLISYLPVAD